MELKAFPDGTDLNVGLILTKSGLTVRRYVIKDTLDYPMITCRYMIDDPLRICTPNGMRAMIAQACKDFPEIDPEKISVWNQVFPRRTPTDPIALFVSIDVHVPRSSLTAELLANTFVLDSILIN